MYSPPPHHILGPTPSLGEKTGHMHSRGTWPFLAGACPHLDPPGHNPHRLWASSAPNSGSALWTSPLTWQDPQCPFHWVQSQTLILPLDRPLCAGGQPGPQGGKSGPQAPTLPCQGQSGHTAFCSSLTQRQGRNSLLHLKAPGWGLPWRPGGLDSALLLQWVWVQSPVGELRSYAVQPNKL